MFKYPKSITSKIMLAKDLSPILKKSKKKKIAMCHGTFDIVHPGHLRHLIYAKSKADILIVSCTSDKYVNKGNDRPYVPDDLRAKNLASLSFVDFVIIDHNEKPLNNLKLLKPHIFVKGFEYSKNGIHQKTKEEIKVINSYGGNILFSPGDFINSSTSLLLKNKPNLFSEKLLSIMENEKINFQKIEKVLNNLKKIKIHVFGDTILDKYTYCTLLGPTTKTPTLSLKKNEEEEFFGGAVIVAKHLKALGVDVTLTTIVGNDKYKKKLISEMKKYKIKLNLFMEINKPTTVKERFWCDGYKMIQIDTVDNSLISENTQSHIEKLLLKDKNQAIIFSDFRHGIFNKHTIEKFQKAVPKKIIKIADSQVSNRWGNILDFKNFDIITPNEKEARFALADQDSGVRPLGTDLFKKSGTKFLILKLSEKGLILFRKNAYNPRNFIALDSFVDNLKDGVGSGDSLLAALAASFIVSKNIVLSCIIGNIAAAACCEKFGNKPNNVNEILNILNRIKSHIEK